MKSSSKGLFTNAIKAKAEAGPVAVTTPLKSGLKNTGKAAPKTAVKAKQKATPMMPTKKLGNHWG